MKLAQDTVKFVRELYGDDFVPLHRPVFSGNEKQYLLDCIDSNYVSSVGQKVIDFENYIVNYTGVARAVATVNGTAALHTCLKLVGVEKGDEVITQALTFVATCNAISYLAAAPVFVDVDRDTMGMSPLALSNFLDENVRLDDGIAFNKKTRRRISAVVPMHTFGHVCRIEQIVQICGRYNIPVVEDAAESLGSSSGEVHSGNFGQCAAFSFNGNKLITTGGGGMIATNDQSFADRAKHITTTSKVPSPYEFVHDEIGYNYRMPNLNAALGCAQMERVDTMLNIKRAIALRYSEFFESKGVKFCNEREGTRANFWLNALVLDSKKERDTFLRSTNDSGVMTRPIWSLMPKLAMFEHCQKDSLENSLWLEDRVVNIPSSVPCIEWSDSDLLR